MYPGILMESILQSKWSAGNIMPHSPLHPHLQVHLTLIFGVSGTGFCLHENIQESANYDIYSPLQK